jgi:uncharacterized membrane protein
VGLTICNHYNAPVTAAIMFYSSESCSGEGRNWEMMGWWNIGPGSCALVYANDLGDLATHWYYYAHASNGVTWAGDGRWVNQVPTSAFNQCWGIGVTPGERVDFAELNVNDNDDWTVNLLP